MAFDPAALGDELIVAGKKQVTTGVRIRAAAVQVRKFGDGLAPRERIATSLVSIRSGLRSVSNLLRPVVNALQFIVAALNGVRVPTLIVRSRNFKFPVIGRVRVVTRVAVGSTRPLASTAVRIDTVRANIANVRATLNVIAGDIGSLHAELPKFRKSLSRTANDMKSGGADLISSGKALQTAGAQIGGS